MTKLRSCAALFVFGLAVGDARVASAQAGGSWGWAPGGAPTGQTYGPGGYGYTPAPPAPGGYTASSDFEIGVLYATATAYGVGTGVWLDAELGIDDPGLRFVAPAVLGVGAPVGVFFLDHPRTPRGVPAAISAGIAIGAGEGLGIWSMQFTSANSDDQWGFKGFARSTFVGSTIGGVAGAAVGFLQEPSPKTSILLTSGALWGGTIGTMFGYGATSVGQGYGMSNDGAALGGVIGYNLGLAAAGGLSTVWVPTYKQLAAMWIGGGLGVAVTTPVYLFYAGSSDDHPAKRGLIFQSIGGALGIAGGAIFTMDDRDMVEEADPYKGPRPPIAQLMGVGAMPVPGGLGAQLTGVLF